jgi:hypothetical protein
MDINNKKESNNKKENNDMEDNLDLREVTCASVRTLLFVKLYDLQKQKGFHKRIFMLVYYEVGNIQADPPIMEEWLINMAGKLCWCEGKSLYLEELQAMNKNLEDAIAIYQQIDLSAFHPPKSVPSTSGNAVAQQQQLSRVSLHLQNFGLGKQNHDRLCIVVFVKLLQL